MITRLDCLIMSDEPPEEYKKETYPQTIVTASPDMNAKQWEAFAHSILDSIESAKILNVDDMKEIKIEQK